METFVGTDQARQLLHNKFVVFLGGSVQRSMYKDLVLLLQRDRCLTLPQLKSKGEYSFEQDCLVEGGRFGPMTNGTEYREVRQYRSDHHLVRFYFLTRVYSSYMESILEDLGKGLKPDVVIISSCVWDITRYGPGGLEQYKENLHKFFGQIRTIVCHDCLILWSLAMPLGKKIKGGFLVPEVSHLSATLCYDIIEANFYSSRLAEAYGLDVLDLHYHFRLRLQHRMPDDVHWDALAHRRISSLLLQHMADAWGVDLHSPPSPLGKVPLQRCALGQYQQSHFRSNRFQLIPPNPGFRPPMVPTQLANQPVQTAAQDYRALFLPMDYPLQLPLNSWQSSATVGVDRFRPPLPVQPHLPPPRLTGNWPPYRQRFGFPPHFQTDDGCVRKKRRRPNFRTHPYPAPLLLVTPRHPAHGW